MEILTIMVVSSAMEGKSDCYVKLVEENYRDDDECIIPKIHLIFLSKRDYKKINEIEKVAKKYFMLENNEGEKELILYHQLRKNDQIFESM